MTVNLVAVVISLSVATIVISEVEANVSKNESGLEVENILAELEAIKQGLHQLDSSLSDIDNEISGRVDNLTQQIASIRENVTESLKEYEKKTSSMNVPFLPIAEKDARKIPVCPARQCLRIVNVRTDIADSIQVLDSVSNATSLAGCALECLSYARCAAVRLRGSPKKCVLLSRHHPHLEVNYNQRKNKVKMTSMLIKKSSKLGYCSFRFRLKRWQQSRYYLAWKYSSWKKAQKECHHAGGKLAELTSWHEIFQLGKYRDIRVNLSFHVGAIQVNGSTEPGKGWRWTPSNITIPSYGFVWKLRRPDNAGGNENVLAAQYFRGRIRFLDNRETKSTIKHLCECLYFGRSYYRFRLKP